VSDALRVSPDGEQADAPAASSGWTAGLRELARFARPARGRLALAAVLALGSAVLELAPFYIVYQAVIRLVEGSATQGELYELALLAGACVIGRFALFAVSTWVAHVAAYEVLYNLRVRLSERLARLPLGYFGRRRSGELKKVMADDVERLELFMAHAIPDMAAALGVWLLTTVWLLSVDWRMAVAAFVLVPVAFALLKRAMDRSASLMGAYHAAGARMNGSVVEYVTGMAVIKVFNRTGDAFSETRRSIEDYTRVENDFSRRFLPLGTAFYTLVAANVVVIVPVGMWLFLSDRIPLTTLLFFFIVGIGYSRPLIKLFHEGMRFSHIASGGTLVAQILSEPTLPDTGAAASPDEHSVELRAVSFSYAEHEVLHDVSFTARAGQVTALVGPSGAGKTTIARLIARFWDVDRGTVLVGGRDVREIGVEALMEEVAFVFQDSFLFHDTVEANLRVGRPDAGMADVQRAAGAARCHEFISALPDGYQTVVGERGATLSGGEKQRIAIARAMLKDAPIVILDEATAFADPDNEAAIQEAISALVQGRTLIVVAHRLSTIAGAEQILVIDDGRIVERGRHAELLVLEGLYERMWSDHVEAQGVSLADATHPPSGVHG
jgi:ATP-binding cassette subfamily B protein